MGRKLAKCADCGQEIYGSWFIATAFMIFNYAWLTSGLVNLQGTLTMGVSVVTGTRYDKH